MDNNTPLEIVAKLLSADAAVILDNVGRGLPEERRLSIQHAVMENVRDALVHIEMHGTPLDPVTLDLVLGIIVAQNAANHFMIERLTHELSYRLEEGSRGTST